MALKTFSYNGLKSSDYGVFVLESDSMNSASRNIDFANVKGRNGDIQIDYGNYNNITITYRVLISDNSKALKDGTGSTAPRWGQTLVNKIQNFKAMLYQKSKYKYLRLEDDYNPGFYRLGIFAGPVDWETMLMRYGECLIHFNCKPQKFFNIPDFTTTVNSNVQSTLRLNTSIAYDIPKHIIGGEFYPIITINPVSTYTVASGSQNVNLTTYKASSSSSQTIQLKLPTGSFSSGTKIVIDADEGNIYKESMYGSGTPTLVNNYAVRYGGAVFGGDTIDYIGQMTITNNTNGNLNFTVESRAWTL